MVLQHAALQLLQLVGQTEFWSLEGLLFRTFQKNSMLKTQENVKLDPQAFGMDLENSIWKSLSFQADILVELKRIKEVHRIIRIFQNIWII